MPRIVHDITNRVRTKDGLIYDIQCELESDHGNIYARIIHDSHIDGERVFVPILFSRWWIKINSIEDYDLIAGWACQLYRNLPTDHSYRSKVVYDPDEETLKRLLTPSRKDTAVDHDILQLLHDFYVSDPNHGISVLSMFMSLEIAQDQLLERLKYFQAREWIELTDFNPNKWLWGYTISSKAIDKIEEQLQLNAQFESRYFKEVDIEHKGDFIFVIMPFKEEEFDQTTYYDFINPIVKKELSIECPRVDDDLIPERIDNKIFTYIKKAKFLIAELTTNNANVIYELAMAHMLNKRVIILTQNDPPKLPFDFDKFPATIYANKEELKAILPKILKSTFEHS
ncbi:MAG: hypothetical protein IIA58_05520 [Candidatus Marinimicrobia bacterium]|nr:hypothetical protein [Candidatus Neomarinimicrobiota bacterium]